MSAECKAEFLSRVEIEGDCWRFKHSGQPGKGRFKIDGRFIQSTQAAYRLLVGELPHRAKVVRLCGNKDCVRPEHLSLGGHARVRAEAFEDRFLAYVTKTEGCWWWEGAKDKDGYGRIRNADGRFTVASRVAYELWKSVIPEGLDVCHTCDNPSCVNPDHLWVGDTQSNQRDKWDKGRGVSNGKRGESHRCAKLTESIVREMRRRYDANQASTFDLAREFAVSDETVRQAVRRITWRHIPNATEPSEVSGESSSG